jgi:hypothetical protein
VNSKDDGLSAAIVEFLLEHFEVRRRLRLADQAAQGGDVLGVDERQAALLDRGQDRIFEIGVLARSRR